MTYPEREPERTRALPEQQPVRRDVPPPAHQDAAYAAEDRQVKRVRAVRRVNAAINFVCALFAVVLVIQIVLVLADANPKNGFASFMDGFAGAVSLGFDGLFTPGSAKAAVFFNYGAAAIVWLLIAAALTYLIRKFALPSRTAEIRY
ncbi:hypothetical protein [Actinocrispum sp. NPDC049592]|uniref:hypothetical protein n=1 Tax=Actinocrispum sp. NPDC049592 TaxID=3154835 RepID=UPI0034192B1D